MLSRKYYKMIAKCIKDSKWSVNPIHSHTLDEDTLINRLCYELKKDNSAFNEDKFISACKEW
jgi:hypothetical protein